MTFEPQVGKTIEQLAEGQSLSVTETITDRDLLLYLGLTNDNNPLYLQQAYAKQAGYQQAIVPPVLLTGIISSSISKGLPGPGSDVVNLSVNFIRPVYHGETITFKLTVIKVDQMKEVCTLSVEGTAPDGQRCVDAVVMVRPAKMSVNGSKEKDDLHE